MQIGLGSGGTLRAVTLHPEVEHIDVVEISPDVLAMSRRHMAEIHRGALDDPRVEVHVADARSFVAATDRTYDLILSDSIHPRFRGNASLYTVDYFRLCAARLRPGGIVSTWLPLYGLSVDDVKGVLASLRAVFPHVQVWYPNAVPNENTVILASARPITIDAARVAAGLERSAVAADLAEVGLADPERLLDGFLMGEEAVAAFTRGARLNTDDRPSLEFLAPRTLDRFGSWRENLAALVAAREPIDRYLVHADDAARARLAPWQAGTAEKLAAHVAELSGRPEQAADHYNRALRLNPKDTAARRRLVGLRGVPGRR
jgi:spermidine synthase